MTIKHEYTEELVCPWCGNEWSDSFEYGTRDVWENLGLIECYECGKEFYGHRIITIDYSTEKANYGTCTNCKEENVVVEDLNTSRIAAKQVCLPCKNKLLNEARKKYWEERDAKQEN